MKEFTGYLIGLGSTPFFFAKLFFFFAAAAVSIAISVKKRDKSSDDTPYSFDRKFFYLDNLIRIWGNIGLGYLIVRFLIPYIYPMQLDLMTGELVSDSIGKELLTCAAIGLFIDRLASWIGLWKAAVNKKVRDKFKNVGVDEESDKGDVE